MDETYAEVGVKVVLGRHTSTDGSYRGLNWNSDMDLCVGKIATIKSVEGNDSYGCLVCVKEYGWSWRVQNMILASDIPLLTPEQKEKLQIHGH